MRTIDPATITLQPGAHDAPPEDCGDPQACFWEYYNWMLGKQFSDSRPPGVSPVLHYFAMRLNDRLDDTHRQALKRFLPDAEGHSPLDGTEDDGHDQARMWMLADWTTRTALPAWLDRAGRDEHAAAVRALAAITSEETAQEARNAVHGLYGGDVWAYRQEVYADLRRKVREAYLKAQRATAADATAADAADAAAADAADATADATAADAADAAAADAADATAAATADAATAAAATAAAATAAAATADAATAAATADAATAATADAATAAAADAATAAATADATARWSKVYERVYATVKAAVQAKLAPTRDELAVSAISLLEAMIHPAAT